MRPSISSVSQTRIRSKWRWSGGQDSPEDGEGGQLLKVKREVEAEARLEESGDGL